LDRVLWDPAFTGLDCIPVWYRLNHSYFPNLKLRLREGVVEWIALDAIGMGNELTFGYGQPDDRWRFK
jgi:hypothetical protein